jgi:hypothetical protein
MIHGAATAGYCAHVVGETRSPFEVCRRVVKEDGVRSVGERVE